MESVQTRVGIQVKGIVQGVGFRPFVFRLAKRLELGGFVRNEGGWVYIEVYGTRERVSMFLKSLRESPPPLSRIDQISVTELPGKPGDAGSREAREFKVVESNSEFQGGPGVPPDSALCEACKKELLDINDRRYLYPFINCTDCGPRFTIVESAPYDRKRTSMKKFPMCPECAAEYQDPGNRRFHAEPNACWDCGPKAFFTVGPDVPAREDESGARVEPSGVKWLRDVQAFLMQGHIVAVKGIGGFHIACNALDPKAVENLRERKRRPRKPFAVMVKDIELVKRWFYLSKEEEDLLTSRQSPIVLLRRKPSCEICQNVAPGLEHFGIMLPYSPLHFLLFQPVFSQPAPSALCMTSGNVSGLPLIFQDEEAKEHLGSIVDGFVWHDRDILRPCDDSVLRTFEGKTLYYRRSRGCVPDTIPVSRELQKRPASFQKILGAGAEGKNTFCLLDENGARLSQHVGDLFNEESLLRYRFLVRDFLELYGFTPDVVATDLHPDYQVNRVIKEMFPEMRMVRVQHHHAHMASCLAEWGITGKSIGIVADGTGYGLDGEIWGGEILYGDIKESQRLYHWDYVRMPGGEKAVMEPWRMAISYLKKVYGEKGLKIALDLMPGEKRGIEFLWPLLAIDQFPDTSSTGRLFDAVGSILGISTINSYDGEVASLLGEMALSLWDERGLTGWEPWEIEERKRSMLGHGSELNGKNESIPVNPIIERAVQGILSGKDPNQIALDFHKDVAFVLGWYAVEAACAKRVDVVTLSGGVFQNPVLLKLLSDYIRRNGFQVYWPQLVPPNDGGISMGQAFCALLGGGV